MLFNSEEFLFLFLPVVFVLFWYGSHSLRWRLGFLTFASYAFYSWWQFDGWQDFVGSLRITSFAAAFDFVWHWRFTLLMLLSSSIDYWAAKWIVATPEDRKGRRKLLLALSLAVNLGILGLFKYLGFFSQIISDIHQFLGGGGLPLMAMILPVGISFYTFESMSYVIDMYRGVAKPAKTYMDYACFISLFPHLIAGPIIRYSDLLHQFRDRNWVRHGPDWNQVNIGLIFFTIEC
jgi:alginate O-acetyltransferase complex protein AlgI